MARVTHPEFRDYYETTKYPFADSASLANTEGDFLGEPVFLDALLYPIGGQAGLYLSRVLVQEDQVELVVGDEAVPQRASASFSASAPPALLPLTDALGRDAGVLVSEPDRLATFQSWEAGTHVFSREQTEFAARVCAPVPELGVRGFLLDDGSVMTGDVWLVGEDGIVVRSEETEIPVPGFTAETHRRQVIRVDAVGDPLFRRRLCAEVFSSPRFVRTVTFQHGCERVVCGPDEFGDLKISVGSQLAEDTVLRIRPVPGGLTFEAVGESLQGVR